MRPEPPGRRRGRTRVELCNTRSPGYPTSSTAGHFLHRCTFKYAVCSHCASHHVSHYTCTRTFPARKSCPVARVRLAARAPRGGRERHPRLRCEPSSRPWPSGGAGACAELRALPSQDPPFDTPPRLLRRAVDRPTNRQRAVGEVDNRTNAVDQFEFARSFISDSEPHTRSAPFSLRPVLFAHKDLASRRCREPRQLVRK